MEFLELLDVFLGFVPEVASVAILIGIVVDVAKKYGLPDGWAGRAALLLNALSFIGFWFAGDYAEEVEGLIDALEIALPVIISVLGGLGVSDLVHKFLVSKRLGFSHKPEEE